MKNLKDNRKRKKYIKSFFKGEKMAIKTNKDSLLPPKVKERKNLELGVVACTLNPSLGGLKLGIT